jgi:outer membrane protein assembly factor BamB
MGNRRLWAILVSIVMLFAFAMPSTGKLLLTQGASKIPFASPVHNIDTGLNYTTVEAGQANIVEHRITTAELEKMKGYVGVSEGGNYNLIINGHGTGLSPPTEEEWTQIAAKAMVVENVSRGLGSEPYFSSVDWSASPWFPPIGDQDGEGSCVSWAVGYYIKTFQEAKEHGWNLTGARWVGVYGGYPTPEYQDKIISPAFVYHLTNFGLNIGTWTPDAVNLVCSLGACSWAKMPWNPSDQASWPSENAWREAAYYRGASTGYEELPVDTADGILSLKNLIASGNLAMIRVNADQYQYLTNEDVWTVDNYVGGAGHLNTIVGYDDNMTYLEGGNWSKGAFKIANSWGVGGWENVPDGCYWISYKAMSQRVRYVMFYRDRIGYVPTLTSSFRIEHPLRGDCAIVIGMGTHDNPDVLKITDYLCGGNFPFCPNNIVFDITEFKDVVPNIYGQQFFIRVYDSGTSTTGTILYFAVEDTVSSDNASSSDPPVTTVNSGFVFADLIFGAWPMFRHDLSHTGYSTSTAPTTNQTLWSWFGLVDLSSPAVTFGTVYVGSNNNEVLALYATSGFPMWRYRTRGPVDSSPAVADGIVYIGSIDHNIYALNASVGSLIWSYTTGGNVYSSPAFDCGVVYVGSTDNNVYALNATTGTLIWSYTTGGNIVWSSPAVVCGVVYVGSTDNNVYALNATTGTLIWSYTTGSWVWSSPAVGVGIVYVGSLDHNIYALNASVGSLIWSYTTGNIVWSSPAVADGVVYVGSCDDNVYALNATTGSLIWSYTTGSYVWSSPAVACGVVYVGSTDCNVYALGAPVLSVTVSPNNATLSVGQSQLFTSSVSGGTSPYSYQWCLDGLPVSFGTGATWEFVPVSEGSYAVDVKVTDSVGMKATSNTADVTVNPAPGDVAVTNVTSTKTVVGQGFNISVAVTAANQGNYTETFNVTLYANASSVASENVTLTNGSSTTIVFAWNTSGFAYGNYTVWAYAEPLPEETDTSDNNFACGTPVHVGVPGDVSGTTLGVYDGTCNMRDIQYLILLFNTNPSSPNWKPNADINNDGTVNMREIQIPILNFNKHE